MGKKRKVVQQPQAAKAAKRKGLSNPFESITTRLKHDVMGRKTGGTVKNSTKARSQAVVNRRKQLLDEFKQENKSGAFVDQRFGEGDSGISEEDKILRRFKTARVQRLKKVKFDLNDGDSTVEQLTHYGESLSNNDAITIKPGSDDDQDEVDLDSEMVAQQHFGGGNLTNGGEKTKKEVMQELISKSKYFKAERQRKTIEQVELADRLNDAWEDIAGLLQYRDDRRPRQAMPKEDDGGGDDIANALLASIRKSAPDEPEELDEYEMELRKIALETRVAASERLKTDEEIAEEIKTKLETLETERQKRMHGELSEEEDTEQDLTKKKKKKKTMTPKLKYPRTDDDLDGNYAIDDKYNVNNQADFDEEEDEEEDDDDEAQAAKELELEEEEEEEEEEDEGESESEAVTPAPKAEKVHLTEAERQKAMEEAGKELPFTFEMPSDYKGLSSLLEGKSVLQQKIIIHRIRACHHLSLGAANRQKLERLYGMLLEHMRQLCLKNSTRIARIPWSPVGGSHVEHACSATWMEASEVEALKEGFRQSLDMCTIAIWEMTQDMDKFAGKFHRIYIRNLRKQLRQRTQTILSNTDLANRSCMPTVFHICYWRLIQNLFPTSDYRHNVVTPCVLMMCEIISRTPIRGARDMAVGIVLAGMLLDYSSDSVRIIPEVIGFLTGCLLAGFSLQEKDVVNVPAPAINFMDGCGIWCEKGDNNHGNKETKLELFMLLHKNNDAAIFKTPAFRECLLQNCLILTQTASDLYLKVPSYPEMFWHFEHVLIVLLKQGKNDDGNDGVMTRAKAVLELLAARRSECVKARQPLVIEKAPSTIKQYTPEFKEDFNPTKDYDPNTRRAEMKRLTKKLKREKKGALKELRRDTTFLAREKQKAEVKREAKFDGKMKAAHSQLEQLAGDANVWARESKKRKKKEKRGML